MRAIHYFIVFFLLVVILIHLSCKKEYSCENCNTKNQPPIAHAGNDTTIVLPIDSVTLDGSASTDDKKIVSYQWTKISGPDTFKIVQPSATKTIVNKLVKGVFQFELRVTDAEGLFSKDTVQVTVLAATSINHVPIANAGNDTTITLPADIATLDGSRSTDPDNNITRYKWTKVSGPTSFNIVNANGSQTQVNDLMEGIYLFELTVTDAEGLFSKDTVQVTINVGVSNNCDISNRPLVSTRLVQFGTLSSSRTGMTVASAGDKILFAGGDEGGGIGSTRVDIYDMVTKTWSTAELSISRWNMVALTVGSKIFFAGGHTNLQNSWDVFYTVDIYDASSNTWSTARLSESRMDLAATVVGNKIFFAGGLGGPVGSPPSTVSKTVDIYDNSNETWSVAALSEARAGLSAVAINNKVYFAGGNKANGIYTVSCTPSRQVDIYDNATGTWSVSNTNEALAFGAAITAGNRIFWAGGSDFDCNTNYRLSSTVEIRDVNTQTSSYACLFQPNAQFKAVVKDNKIVFFTGQGDVKNKFDIYDITNDTWSIGTLSQDFENVATSVISIGNSIYVAEWGQVYKLEF